MTVHRLAKYQTADPFTRVPNEAINDDRLDLKARGLLLLMLSKPAHWNFTERNLARDAGVGRDQLRTAMATLIDAGYVWRHYATVEDGPPVMVTTVCDRARQDGPPEPDLPGAGYPEGPVIQHRETRPHRNEGTAVTNEDPATNENPSTDLTVVDPEPDYPDEVRELTRTFAQYVKANGHRLPREGSKSADGWLREMDRLLRIGPPGDGDDPPPSFEEVRDVIGWALATSDFWPANIRSVPKFRQQYTTLRAQSRRTPGTKPAGGDLAQRYSAAAADLRSRT